MTDVKSFAELRAAVEQDRWLQGMTAKCIEISPTFGLLLFRLVDYIDSQKQRDRAEAVIDAAGWYWTVEEPDGARTRWRLEPKLLEPVKVDHALFHATPRSHLDSILSNGVQLHKRSTTFLNRRYFTPRSFHAPSLNDAMTYIRSADAGTSADDSIQLAADARDRWAILTFEPREELYYPDAEFMNCVWTDVVIANDRLKVVDGW